MSAPIDHCHMQEPDEDNRSRQWHAKLELDYLHTHQSTVVKSKHSGPLRVLQSLYPEGKAICHSVLVHPPSGLVGGDTLDIQLKLAPHTHALITTPGATRFYRTEQGEATQRVNAHIGAHARLEWLPLETIAYNGCNGINRFEFELEPSAELMAWDITALGLPHAQQPFQNGQVLQHLEVKGTWLERGRIQATDKHLMDGPVGLAKHRCMATLVFATGQDLSKSRRERALETARALTEHTNADLVCGLTSPNAKVVVLRSLSSVVEPAQNLLRQVWAVWRQELWDLKGDLPRIWSM